MLTINTAGIFRIQLLTFLLLQTTIAKLCSLSPNRKSNFKLQGHVFKTFPLPTSDFCVDICGSKKDCKSVNYYQSNETCELNNATYLTHPESLVAAASSEFIHLYWRAITSCSKELCGGLPFKCVVNCDGYTYRCESCAVPMGMEDGRIADNQLRASTTFTWDRHLKPQYARLHLAKISENKVGWVPSKFDPNQWIQVDLLVKKAITAVATQGLADNKQWVKTYSIQYSDDGSRFTDYKGGEVLTGNTDKSTVVMNVFNPVIDARFIKLRPKSWEGVIALRMELYECNE